MASAHYEEQLLPSEACAWEFQHDDELPLYRIFHPEETSVRTYVTYHGLSE